MCPTVPPGGAGLGLSPNDPNNPFNNLSSEAPDVDLFIGRRPTPPGLGNPPLGSTWFATGCLGFAFSTVSQEDADLQAAAQATLCLGPLWPVVVNPNPNQPPNPDLPPEPPIITPRPIFFNQPQSCDFACPDGSIFTYTVPAGVFAALSQLSANAMAASYACNQVVANRLCFGNPPTARTCLDSGYASSIAVSSINTPITFTIQSGSLPPGLVAAQSTTEYFLSGTPSLPGDYTFLLRATDATGGFIEKQISISVFGIINTSPLPEATVGTPYSETLVYAGTPAGAVVYSIILGALPAGLNLNSSTGEISGTPTTEESAGFAVRITDDGISCVKQFEIEVAAVSDCPDWDTLLWQVPTIEEPGGGQADFTPDSLPSASFIAHAFDPPLFIGIWSAENYATMTYDGPGCNCNLQVDLFAEPATIVNDDDCQINIYVFVDGLFVYALDIYPALVSFGNPLVPGVYNFPFAMPDTGGVPLQVEVYAKVFCNSDDELEGANVQITCLFTNV